MKNIKKIFALLLTVAMIASLAACGNSGKKEETKAEGANADFKVALVIGVGGLGDGSFNDLLKDGLDMAVEKYGIADYQLIEPKEVAEFEGHFTDLSASGEYDLIVGGGFDAIEAMQKVAAEFPDQKYLFVDGEITGCDNVTSVTCRQNEKTYLLGQIAAMSTEADTMGVVLALDVDSLRMFSAGYMAGALSVKPDMKFSVKIVGSFSDTTTAKELTLALMDEGVDIVYAAAGGSGLGCFAAAEEHVGELRCVGVDTNQCLTSPDTVIVSGLCQFNNIICNGIGQAIEGKLVGGHQTQGLAEGALSYTCEGSNVPPSQEALDLAEETKAKIISGEVVAPSTYEEIGFIAE